MNDNIRLFRLFVLCISFIALITSCKCKETPGEEVPNGSEGCTSDADCVALHDSRWYCADSECVMGPRYCEEEGDAACCPGQVCSRHGVCRDQYETCDNDDECRIAGQKCLPRMYNGSIQDVCTFELCDNGICTNDLYCFAGFCVGENPCRGGCPSGQACVPSNNLCHPAPMCDDMTCPPGSILTFSDPENVDDDCDMDSLACICEDLPPLNPRDTGRHSSITGLPEGGVAISAYNGDYGDLVVFYFDSTGNKTGIDWVDGIPEGYSPVANPAGARQGISEPGPNVGKFTSIVSDSTGTLHISYFDVTESRLKYARGNNGDWTVLVVDEEGDVGRYSDISIDDSGIPSIAYFRKRGLEDEEYSTALKIARARTASPSNSSDWFIAVVESAEIPETPCGGGCETGYQCVMFGDEASCQPTATGCDSCPDGQVCVDVGTGPSCRTRVGISNLKALPMGTGLFPSIVSLPDGTASIAYYDNTGYSGKLKIAMGIDPSLNMDGTVVIIDGAEDGDDKGRFPSLALTEFNDYALVYQDTLNGQLLWGRVTDTGQVANSGIVDDGIRPHTGGINLIGKDNSILIDFQGHWHVFYQDATAGEVLMASRTGNNWTVESVDSTGSAGFWTDAAYVKGKIFASHAVLKAETSRPMSTELRIHVINP